MEIVFYLSVCLRISVQTVYNVSLIADRERDPRHRRVDGTGSCFRSRILIAGNQLNG